MFRYESRHEKLIPKAAFIRRMAHSVLVALGLVGISLAIGMLGYHALEALSWTDSFLNASMILGGMGPVDAMKTEPGKLFAGLYSLYCGLGFMVVASLLFAPIAHRILHGFHYDADQEGKS
ncbi:MAG: hypothetical protein V4640_07315 [Verrucomicrobiota bacterium]